MSGGSTGRLGAPRDGRRPSVTIDGPAGSGKSTTARLAAERLGYRYIDSGALYRALALRALEEGLDLDDGPALARLAEESRLDLEMERGNVRVLAGGCDVSGAIRSPAVGEAASALARHADVRQVVTEVQRRLAAPGGVVLEGRDSGTVVLPGAEVKIYLDASLAVRAERRRLELGRAGTGVRREEVEEDLRTRDARDSTREHSPLRKPEGAVVIDTTRLTIEEQVSAVVDAARRAEADGGPGPGADSIRRGMAAMRPVYRSSWKAIRVLGSLLLGYRVLGPERVPFPGGCIVASNHVSFWDPPLVGAAVPREVHFLAKRELFRNRLFGRLISSYNAIPLHRDGYDRRGLRSAQNLLRSGAVLVMFPEGTRQKSGRVGEGMAGVGLLAVGAGVPVVPAYIHGTSGFWKNWVRRGRLSVRFGAALRCEALPEGAPRADAARALARSVMEAIRALEASALGERGASVSRVDGTGAGPSPEA